MSRGFYEDEPEIVLFGERTTGLDPIGSGTILRLFASVHRQRNLIGILVSHDIPAIFGIVQESRCFVCADGARLANAPLFVSFLASGGQKRLGFAREA